MFKESERKRELAKEIREGRESLDLDQATFAEMLEISSRTLQRYESGETIPDALTYKVILGLFQNIYFQEAAFVNAARSQILAAQLCQNSRALKTIKCLIFDAIVSGRTNLIYPGTLSRDEFQVLLNLGYKIRRANSSLLIDF